MLPLLARGDPGITRELVIDGVTLSVIPASLRVQPDPVGDYQDMLDGGGREWQRRPHFDGIADHMDRYTISAEFPALMGENRVKMEEARVAGGTHRVVLWRMIPIRYTLKAGLQRYYFPRFRKCAAWLYDGLLIPPNYVVSTELFPTTATVDGGDLDVTYAEGPELVSPGAGGLVIARMPDVTGAAVDYTAFVLGDVPEGDELLTIWMVPSFEMSMRAPSIGIALGQEAQSYTFVEL